MEIPSHPGNDSYVQEEFLVLIDVLSIDVFRDLVGDRGKQDLSLGFVDGIKHRVRAPAVLQSS